MMIFFSKDPVGFYCDELHMDAVPEGAVQITAQEHSALLLGQSIGKQIVADGNGYPVLVDPPPPSRDQLLAAARAQRDELLQYAALRIGPLNDALDLGVATADEKSAFARWRGYRIEVSRVDLAAESPAWPNRPEEWGLS